MPIIASRASVAYGAGFGAITTAPYLGPYGAFDALATVTLSTATPTITFAGLPTEYKHLQIRGISLSSSANTGLLARFNNDSTTVYGWHGLEGNGVTTVAQTYAANSQTGLPIGYTGHTTYPSAFICDILDYKSDSKYKIIRSFTGNADNGENTRYIAHLSGRWQSTAPINTITIYHGGSVDFNTYSTFSLYGVK